MATLSSHGGRILYKPRQDAGSVREATFHRVASKVKGHTPAHLDPRTLKKAYRQISKIRIHRPQPRPPLPM
jgi:hypothetical protein